jgi:CRP/FNR family cyclic AMP-dependent transcriptional regulator
MSTETLWQAAHETLAISDQTALDALAQAAKYRTLAPGNAIICQDDASDHVCIILSGDARVVLLSESGQEVWVDVMQAGAILGEIAALTGVKRTSSIIADNDVVLASYTAPVFMGLMEQHSTLAICLARILAERVSQTTRRMFAISSLSAPGRAFAELLRMSTAKDGQSSRFITPVPSLTDLAQRIDTTRETVSRAVSKLQKRGLLIRHEDGLELLDPEQITRLLSRMGNSR